MNLAGCGTAVQPVLTRISAVAGPIAGRLRTHSACIAGRLEIPGALTGMCRPPGLGLPCGWLHVLFRQALRCVPRADTLSDPVAEDSDNKSSITNLSQCPPPRARPRLTTRQSRMTRDSGRLGPAMRSTALDDSELARAGRPAPAGPMPLSLV